MYICSIVARASNDVIGKDGALPWRLEDDMWFFKLVTNGRPVVMGRRTAESLTKPLSNRANIVVSKTWFEGGAPEGFIAVPDIDQALSFCEAMNASHAFFIGGEQIYREIMPMVQVHFITEVHVSIEGDTKFPSDALDESKFYQLLCKDYPRNHRNVYPYTQRILIRGNLREENGAQAQSILPPPSHRGCGGDLYDFNNIGEACG